MPSDTVRVAGEIARIHTFFPVLSVLGDRWAHARPWEGRTLALHLHLTTLTATLVRELVLGGGRWIVSAANPATTDHAVVSWLRSLGIEVHSGGGSEDGIDASLASEPELFADVGFQLGAAMVRAGVRPRGGVEITRSGITRLRAERLAFPVMNLNDGRLKPAIENRHGVGEGLWQAFTALTGIHLAGHRVLVVGYGPVGAGVAAYARAGGATVEVLETDPVRRLIAHYDGYGVIDDPSDLGRAQVLVTATGRARVVTPESLARCRDGVVLINAGHGGDEIDVEGLRATAAALDEVSPRVARYRLPSGRHVVLLGAGHPLNIVMNSGSQEPVLLHFALLGLALEWFTRHDPPPGEVALPDELEEAAARAALAVLR